MLVLVAGLFQGSFLLPMKYTKKWSWENSWFGFSLWAYLILPWAQALLTVPHLKEVLAHTSRNVLARTFVFGLGWGLGALLMGLGVDYVGLALGFAVVLGLAASIGTLIPLLVLSPERLLTRQGSLIIAGIFVMLIGILICSWAGTLKEEAIALGARAVKTHSRKTYVLGLVFCALSGVLSSCGNLGFAFGSPMTDVSIEYGTEEVAAANPFWALITAPLFVCNAAYCLYLFVRNKTFIRYMLPETRQYHLLATCMGVLWLGGMTLYGVGANRLGRLGPSIGWAMLISTVVIVANVWGLSTGEWKGSGRKPLRVMGVGLVALLVAIFIIGFSNFE